ncbi:E3 ubiquitin-protein ligase RAD18 [Pseudohyphozyma bogoriensis]|nr:E3 ubiquitin-protein ligase RAD18 [Pseudohyphozyma bogoriensis]
MGKKAVDDVATALLSLDDITDFDAPALQSLESTLRCPICVELFKAPVILTGCSHSFCSLCIRQVFLAQGGTPQCPTCFQGTDAGRAKSNLALSETVAAWAASRSAILALQTAANAARQQSRASTSSLIQDDEPPRSYSTRSSAKVDSKGKGKAKVKAEPVEETVDESSDIEIVEPPKGKNGKGKGKAKKEDEEDPDVLVHCPICSSDIRNGDMYTHVERCDGKKRKVGDTKAAWGSLMGGSGGSDKKGGKPRSGSSKAEEKDKTDMSKHIPAQSLTGMTIKGLKEILEGHGLSTDTPSQDRDKKLEHFKRRIQHYTAIFNANCDLPPNDPRRKTEKALRKELATWEETQDTQEKFEVGNSRAHARKYASDFQALIGQARPKPSHKVERKPDEAVAASGEEPLESNPDVEDVKISDTPLVSVSQIHHSTPKSHFFAPPAPPSPGTLAAGDLSSPSRASTSTSSDSTPRRFPSSLKRPREESPFDPRGPAPSQRNREEEMYYQKMEYDDSEDEEDSGEGFQVPAYDDVGMESD